MEMPKLSLTALRGGRGGREAVEFRGIYAIVSSSLSIVVNQNTQEVKDNAF